MTSKKNEKIKEEILEEELKNSLENEAKEIDEAEKLSEEKIDEEIEKNTKENDQELSEVDKLKKELAETKDSFLRLNAEYQNFRRRATTEKADIYKYANEKLFVDLLPVVDNFERGFSSIDLEENPALLEGIELIKKSLMDFLDKNGVKEVKALNTPFDHDKHHAVMTEEKEGVEADIVIEEFQKGYEMNGKVIRHSMVKVSC
ncbi:nucleotide exchange factor GrpE [Helicovermis profundi]|uniref:Protein GrpE n=1 Tax=Helicovermis profundi TaxID=3065157 RepID=A0AAU9EFZ9_9FIRM|nr:nucleotide exchange factor GrpE [Clostridia bacterium S502]